MKKKWMAWILGGLITVSAVGMSFGANIASAADAKQGQMMQCQGTMQDPKATVDMMKSPDTQKQCVEMMKSPEMQKAMIDMMKQPEMQAVMKQMLQKDAGFHQMMLDLVNSVDMNMDHGQMNMQNDSQGTPGSMPMNHSGHHM